MTSRERISIGVQGATGRSGSLVLRVAAEFPSLQIVSALVSPHSPSLGHPSGVPGVLLSADQRRAVEESDVMIDFSTPEATMQLAEICAEMRTPILVATTGFSPQQRLRLETLAATCPIALVSNTSVGVFVASTLVTEARRMLGDEFDVEVLELHHRHKKDAPSGTALTLAEAAKRGGEERLVRGRAAMNRPREGGEIAVESIRGGDIVGEHTVYFIGLGERIEISHRVNDRAIFARGALRMAVSLSNRPPGLYGAGDLIAKG